MNHPPARPSTVVLVGNIPFEYAEEQLIEIFKAAGPVVNFQLVFDRETSKPKGFGFCEFFDVETAQSAVRNLRDYEVGGRKLRVDFANPSMCRRYGFDVRGGPVDAGHADPSGMGGGQARGPAPNINPIVAFNSVAASNPNISVTDAISKTLASMSQPQLHDLLAYTRNLALTQPDQAHSLLSSNPQLTYALFQAMLMLGLIDPQAVQQIMQSQQPANQLPPPPPPMVPNVPGVAAPGGIPAGNPLLQQQALLAQLLTLPPQEVERLPPAQKEQLRLLMAQVAAAQGSQPGGMPPQ
ncbi:hypothetical protein IWQ60_011408 [Tieghemiomyces parasiticus]|uniref:RRM domain-containing protein n=1 Tax=Tieghemiomyces parasiticus TaxID=78921 RepID=A0A9W8DMB2_9FUNG|nr:hypothetical protein IWQ60_011408 [Tieghemiomyces parasiticus]